MAFVPLKPENITETKVAVIANSQTLSVGDVIIPDGTNAAAVKTAANTTGIVLGVVKSIVQPGGIVGKNSVTVASDNETKDQISVQYIPAYIDVEYEADLSQAAGTTSGSNKMGQFNLSTGDGGVLDETSYGVFSTQKQFFSYGVSPESTTKVRGKFSTTKTV